jgi:nucleotide-binding universal stress UspA family protein
VPHLVHGRVGKLASSGPSETPRSWLEGQVDLMRGEGTKTLEPHLVLGRPDAAIVWLADEIEAGLVVVGSRGHGRMRALVGSVSDSVVHHAH